MSKLKNIYIATFSVLVLLILFLFAMSQLGYEFNQNFFTFDRKQCIAENFETKLGRSGIEGCIFWMRNNSLEKTQNWEQAWQQDEDGCLDGFENIRNNINDSQNGKECSYATYKDQQRQKNWEYLTSSEQNQFYDYCVDQMCPSPTIFERQ